MLPPPKKKYNPTRIKKSRNPAIHYEQPISCSPPIKLIPIPDIPPSREIAYKIYPNGEFGIGYCPPAKERIDDRRYDNMQIYGRQFESYDRTHELEDGRILEDGTDVQQREVPPPKLGIGAELSQTPRKKGLKGITGYGRKMLRNCGTIIDTQVQGVYGAIPQMGTLTIPSLSPERMTLLCASWSEITRRFFQECKRLYARRYRRFDYAFATEIQPGRWERLREVGLHIHFLFISYREAPGEWTLPDNWVRATWRRIICSIVGEEGVIGQLNYRREPVRQSSAAYLAKYASKGTEFIREVADVVGAEVLPSQWWGCSTRLKKCIKMNTLTRLGRNDQLLLHLIKSGDTKYIKYSRTVLLTIAEDSIYRERVVSGQVVLGYGGLLTRAGIELFFPQGYKERIREYMRCTLDNP